MEERKKTVIVPKTFLGYELNAIQDIYFNYLTPTLIGALFYIVHFTGDVATSYRHFYDGNPVWGSLTLLFIYLPVILCFIIVISSWELWAEQDGCGPNNIKWALFKIAQHLLFPIWSMWRYAERLFWSIEAIRSENDEDREDATSKVYAPRTIEFYYFLQGYVQAIPQIFLQLHILLRYLNETERQTVDVQIMSLVMNIAKMALTTTLYQRFKTQKIGGRYYPWFKPYKYVYASDVMDQALQRSVSSPPKFGIIYSTTNTRSKLENQYYYAEDEQSLSDNSSNSSSYYLQPVSRPVQTRETSIVGGPRRHLFTTIDETDFPKPIYNIKALPEDDMAGKTISFLWWFTFILGRMLTISAFAYFYTTEVIWLLSSHFVLAVSLLLYDAQANVIRKTKAVYYVFVGLLYLFVLIEFKTKFKKVKFWYYGFFTLTFTENIAMCLTWWIIHVDNLYDDYWFKYIFKLVIICISLSLFTLLFYVNVMKPKSVVVAEQIH